MSYYDINDSSIQKIFDKFFERENIEEQCTEESLVRLHEAFLVSENEEMDLPQLRDAFENILQIKMSEEEFSVLFTKINLKRDGNATWDEFISYLLVEFQEKDTALQWQILELPIRGVPHIQRSCHRTPICRITFYPEVLPDRSVTFHRGYYVTISNDGFINFWTLDLNYERSAQSSNPYLKVQPTAITDMIVMPDIQILCTSSTECDLRFYDIVAKKFDLRIAVCCIVIRAGDYGGGLIGKLDKLNIFSLEYAVVSMSYYFSQNIKEDSYVVLGDMSGSVKILSFSPIDRGPFKQMPERDVLFLRCENVNKGELKGMKVTEIKNVHSSWVSQVAYYGSLKAFMSSSRCSICSLLLSDPTGTRIQYKFRVKMGISCFTFCEGSQTLVTGGSDCIVRVWNPFVTRRANCIFQGHHTAICALVVQNSGRRIYSLSKDRCIKVWDVLAQSCIQTYTGLPSEIGEHTPMTIVYNTLNHKMIIASMMIAVLICDPVINEELSDGFTHTKPISCVLYNHLYKVIVSTGLDSCIIVWDPWLGHRLYLVKNAHRQLIYGQCVDIEITAACFDESEQLLVTGARDGTLKVWNFNTGTCLRNMAIENQCEITSLVWLENRILSSGANRKVTEFAVTSDADVYRKSWGANHTEDILCSAMRYPQVLATATYNGEVILWRLETGQPYRKYQVNDPTTRYSVTYRKGVKEKSFGPDKSNEVERTKESHRRSTRIKVSRHQESALSITRIVAVRSMLFLTTRQSGANVGTLLVSLDSGLIQVWSHHPAGGFLEAFSVIHTTHDCALSLATDPENNFLVTGHSVGYIKVWYLANYLVSNPPKVRMPLLNLEFPFLWKDRIDGRAKRAVRDQPLPMLLSSVRGHRKAIVSIQIIPDTRIIISGSADHSVRLWTLGGRYISTLGTFRPWTPILPTIPVHEYFQDYKLPPDIKRFASFTTMKVLKGGVVEKGKAEEDEGIADFLKDTFESERPVLDGRRLTISVMDKSVLMILRDRPILDNSLPYIPVYTHLRIHPLQNVDPPELPSSLQGQREFKKVQIHKTLKPSGSQIREKTKVMDKP